MARIDALGHVNRTLVGVRFETDDPPAPGAELFANEEPVGSVTSSTFSPRVGSALALAYIRRGHNTPGTPLQCSLGEAQVISLPV